MSGRVRRTNILDGLVAALKQINGQTPSYWSNVGGRVYRRLREPEEVIDGEFPILFVVQRGQPGPVRNDEHTIKDEIRATIVGYVRETAPRGALIARAPAAADDLLDDVKEALLQNIRLSGSLDGEMLILESYALSGLDPNYGVIVCDVSLPYRYGKADLGPG